MKTLVFLLSGLFLYSCEVAKPLAFKPKGNASQVYYQNGAAVYSDLKDSILVYVNDEGLNGTNMCFRMRVKNLSEHPIDLNPLQFRLLAEDTTPVCSKKTIGLEDPEEDIHRTESDLQYSSRQLGRVEHPGLLYAALDLATSVEILTTKDEARSKWLQHQQDSTDQARALEVNQLSDKVARQQNMLNYYKGLIRRNTVFPGESVEGIIRFRLDYRQRYVMVLPMRPETVFQIVFDPR